MKIEETSIFPLFLILCAVSVIYWGLYSSPSILEYDDRFRSSYGVVLMIFVLNSIIFAFLVEGHRPSSDDFDWPSPFLLPVDGVEEEHAEDRCNSIDYSDDYCSDGYDEDDDDGSHEEVDWGDEQDYDYDDLNKRIEEFIAKVNKGWREEWLREHFNDG